MTITSLIPGRREQRKHRVQDALRKEKWETGRLTKALDEATCQIVALATEIDQLKAERNRLEGLLDEAAISQGTANEAIRQLEGVVRLRDQRIADLERKVDVGVKAEHVIAKTQPIPVITPVMPLHDAPFATTDPGHVPSWAKDEPAA